MNSFAWIEAEDVASAIAAGASPRALYKAGGVDVADRLKERIDAPSVLVNLRRVRELDFLREERGTLAIGPLVTLARLASDERVRKGARALAEAAEMAATPQIRELATLGGNLAQRPRCAYFRSELFHCRKKGGEACFAIEGEHADHAIFDNDRCAIVHPSGTATALVALGASVKLRGPEGERTLPLEQFFVLPAQDVLRENVLRQGELIVEVSVPARRQSAYLKLMQKQTFDWPLAEAAVALSAEGGTVREARVVLGAAAPVPRRATAVEKALVGKKLADDSARAAAQLATEGATPLPRNGHKVPLFQTLVWRTLRAAGGLA